MQRGVVVHYAVIPAEADHGNCPARFDQLFNGHVAAGYNPAPAYNTVRCAHGVLMGGRGWGRMSAANGTTLSNLTLYAVNAMISVGDEPSIGLLNGLRDDIDMALSLSSDGQEIHYHGQIVATSCAGDPLNAWVLAGAPRPSTLPPPEELDMKVYRCQDTGAHYVWGGDERPQHIATQDQVGAALVLAGQSGPIEVLQLEVDLVSSIYPPPAPPVDGGGGSSVDVAAVQAHVDAAQAKLDSAAVDLQNADAALAQ